MRVKRLRTHDIVPAVGTMNNGVSDCRAVAIAFLNRRECYSEHAFMFARLLHYMQHRAAPAMALALVVLSLPPPASAQLLTAPTPTKDFELPGTWLNAVPPTKEGLAGKAVLLYFFEETCPRCKAQWPALMEIAERHRDDPIAFVAVNSGTPAAAIQDYAQRAPDLADHARSRPLVRARGRHPGDQFAEHRAGLLYHA